MRREESASLSVHSELPVYKHKFYIHFSKEKMMKSKNFIVLLFTLIIFTSSSKICRAVIVQWPKSDGGNGNYYEVVSVPEGINWLDAKNESITLGGYLCTITSFEENAFVISLLDVDSHFASGHGFDKVWGPWIGGFQPEGSPEPSGNWQWITGEPFVYNCWYGENPDNSSEEDYLSFFYWNNSFGWNDLALNGAYNEIPMISFVVEYPIPEPSTLLLLGLGAIILKRRMR